MIDLTLFAVSTAMRLGEIVGLRWENLDETNRTIIIRERKHPTKKTTNHQKVPLPFGTCTVGGQLIDPLQIILKQPSAWSTKGRIFPHAAQSVSRAFQRATDNTAIVDLRFHDLRHDGASRLFEAGWPIERVALVTGHRDWKMLRRYTQLRAKIFTADNRTQRPAARWWRSARSASRLERTASPGKSAFGANRKANRLGRSKMTRSRTGLAAITVSRSHRPT